MKIKLKIKNREVNKVPIHTEFIKLDALLKLAGITLSGGEAKKAVQSGLVMVNDQVCIERGRKIYPGGVVSYMGQVIKVK